MLTLNALQNSWWHLICYEGTLTRYDRLWVHIFLQKGASFTKVIDNHDAFSVLVHVFYKKQVIRNLVLDTLKFKKHFDLQEKS